MSHPTPPRRRRIRFFDLIGFYLPLWVLVFTCIWALLPAPWPLVLAFFWVAFGCWGINYAFQPKQ